MGKRTRIILYALSLVTMLAMVTLIIFSHGRQSGEPAKDALSETDISSTEEPVQIPEAEEPEETEAADGQGNLLSHSPLSWIKTAIFLFFKILLKRIL